MTMRAEPTLAGCQCFCNAFINKVPVTSGAVVAVRGVATATDQVIEVAGAIAAAVEQQGAATREIASQV